MEEQSNRDLLMEVLRRVKDIEHDINEIKHPEAKMAVQEKAKYLRDNGFSRAAISKMNGEG